uniref:Cytochrome c551 peroxidase n=1 Tax=Magnetococcus massalia (strain MO-1) TaxID=451514 RepID=A0A1S7LKH3_MAGMO|nr:Cytochrome c551 peroxidase [Candidatus Magnetococcus massalia]
MLLLSSWSVAASPRSREPIKPIPIVSIEKPALVELGRQLFHEPKLSLDESISCAHCHPLDRGGVDGLPVSSGVDGREGRINTPTVYNSALQFRQFWDGRAATLEEQVDGPLTNPVEMAANWPLVIQRLEADKAYREQFGKLFAEGITPTNVRAALAHFQRTLLTPDSPFDRHLMGEAGAITKEQRKGYQLFKSYGCSACHQGRGVGGNMFQKMGVMKNYFKQRGGIQHVDYGRYNHTGRALHRFHFKVPSLRNVALTAPYFHDASAKSLPEAVRIMGYYQLGRSIPADHVQKIVAFLKSLTGKGLQ